jgi:hypothetical protein
MVYNFHGSRTTVPEQIMFGRSVDQCFDVNGQFHECFGPKHLMNFVIKITISGSKLYFQHKTLISSVPLILDEDFHLSLSRSQSLPSVPFGATVG